MRSCGSEIDLKRLNWCAQSSLPYVLSDPRDPRYSLDRKRECMLRCLQARDEMPNDYSDLGFSVATEKWHPSYKDRCQCLKAGYSCEAYTERDRNKNYMNYRMYDTRAAPTPKPTPAPNQFEYMNYTMIGHGACKKYHYLPGLVIVRCFCVPECVVFTIFVHVCSTTICRACSRTPATRFTTSTRTASA